MTVSRSLLDQLFPPKPEDWRPSPLPLIASHGIKEICLNTETTGFLWWENDRPIGASIDYPSDDPSGFSSQYISWGHKAGNIDPDLVREWMRVELRGVRITNLNTRFDCHQLRAFGVDLEKLGCEVSDVGHYAALLDDHRQRSSLDAIAADYFGPIEVPRLDESRMASYTAGQVAPRSIYNVQLVRRLKQVMWPQLEEQDLHRVRALEDKLIWVVVAMEEAGSPIDLDLLKQWERRSKQQIDVLQKQISTLSGRKIQTDLFGQESGFLNPDSPKEMEALFQQLHLPIVRTSTGRPSFAHAVLEAIDHPVINQVKTLNRLIDLRNKYLVSDLTRIGSDGILRYALHQMRAVKDDSMNSGEAGTVTGRFSSTEITRGVGVNIQQRIKVAKQRVAWGYDEEDATHDDEIYLIRQLHVPASGLWLSSDMMQVEYRLFANECNSPRINAAYAANPLMSFHKFMHAQLKQWKPNLTYRRAKDVSFAKVYAAGPSKIAFMLGFITAQQLGELQESKARGSHPLLRETMEILKIYDQEIPECGPLIRRCSQIAKERGYIKSILGRRQRFPDGYRLHKALNSRIQPSAADVLKTKLVELHAAREDTQLTLRFSVHDEIDGDVPNVEYARRVAKILNHQTFDFKIPLLWETGVGKNWAQCTELKESDSDSINRVRDLVSREQQGRET